MRILLSLFFVCLQTLFASEGYGQQVDSICRNWNAATLNSLERQKNNASSNNVAKEYTKLVSNFYTYFRVKKENEIDSSSMRYKILKILKKEGYFNLKQFYIVESNVEMGARNVIRCHVLVDSGDEFDVFVYALADEQWRRIKSFRVKKWSKGKDLCDFFQPQGQGINEDDIIFTKFESKSISSEYYYYLTFSNLTINKLVRTP